MTQIVSRKLPGTVVLTVITTVIADFALLSAVGLGAALQSWLALLVLLEGGLGLLIGSLVLFSGSRMLLRAKMADSNVDRPAKIREAAALPWLVSASVLILLGFLVASL